MRMHLINVIFLLEVLKHIQEVTFPQFLQRNTAIQRPVNNIEESDDDGLGVLFLEFCSRGQELEPGMAPHDLV